MESGEDGWWGFLELCSGVKGAEALNELLWLFLTHEERADIATRFLIVRELLKGEKTQREIAKDLGVSIAKITRGSNYLKTISKNLRRLLESRS
ncbi:MAG TPA: trp operon repressor [Chlamydiales bacterium]|nr:trp operon repressor [Chlamydiales bacterium]